jgi:apolipoprotein N-acyltransferase
VLASAVLAGLFARGAWPLGFVVLVPWLRVLDARATMGAALLAAWAMSVAYTAAVFPWFGGAIGQYTGLGTPAGVALLMLAAPVFQPQFLALALARRLVSGRFGYVAGAAAGVAAWIATEAFLPRMLDDTLGYGLHPSALLRQAADLGGVAGLTVLLLLANEAVAHAWAWRGAGLRAVARPIAVAALVPLLLAGYGVAALAALRAEPAGPTLRVGLVQSNITDYERLRREKGAGAVVREVLDTHYAMSHDAVERQRVQAVLWSETVYPTTFGKPKSEAGAELDEEIAGIVDAAGVPFVFGTYDRDARGEYNAAAFVAPGDGIVGVYRKTRTFPLTEHVPAWLDTPALRHWLPWTGGWLPGDGARVLPLRLADGREVPALPLICLDAVDGALVADGARLGAQVILTMSNDSWFDRHPLGAELHLGVAVMRSVETRLPQFRVTTSGYSAVIDAGGTITAGSRMGERTLVIGEVRLPESSRSLFVAWGDWVGRVALVVLVLLLAAAVWPRARAGQGGDGAGGVPGSSGTYAARVSVFPPAARAAAGALRVVSRGVLLGIGIAVLLGEASLAAKPLDQLRLFVAGVFVPEVAAWLLLRAWSATASVAEGRLQFVRGSRRLAFAVADVARLAAWRLPLPMPGVALELRSGAGRRLSVAGADPVELAAALEAAGAVLPKAAESPTATAYTHACLTAPRRRLEHPLALFVLLPLVLALPAFRLHQHIAYGGSFGELHTFGMAAYLTTFALWWAGWVIGVAFCRLVLALAVDAATWAAARWRPARAPALRRRLERLGLVVLYIGLPGWLLLRMAGG